MRHERRHRFDVRDRRSLGDLETELAGQGGRVSELFIHGRKQVGVAEQNAEQINRTHVQPFGGLGVTVEVAESLLDDPGINEARDLVAFGCRPDIASVQDKADEFGLRHPIMIDNDFPYWKAMGNRYWPSFYLIDKHGLVRHAFIDETHRDDKQAQAVCEAVAALLAEPL